MAALSQVTPVICRWQALSASPNSTEARRPVAIKEADARPQQKGSQATRNAFSFLSEHIGQYHKTHF